MTTSRIFVSMDTGCYGLIFNSWIDCAALAGLTVQEYIQAQMMPLFDKDFKEDNEAFDDRESYIENCDYLVLDAEGLACQFLSGESFDLEGYQEVATYLEDNDDFFSEEAVIGYLNNCGSWDEDNFEDAYCGHWESDCWSSMRNYAYVIFTECNEIPEHLEHYIDWAAVERDFDMEHWEYEGHIYRSC
jgi:hypothetical protein